MRARAASLALGLLAWSATLLPSTPSIAPGVVVAQSAPGRILAPASHQLAWLDLAAPRPRPLTHFESPAYVTDVGVDPTASVAALAVAGPHPQTGAFGGDLMTVDLTSGQVSALVSRSDAGESLGAPAWSADGASLLFERQDTSVVGTAYPGAATVLYPTRIDLVRPDGSGRAVLVDDGRQPTPAPDGTAIAFLRSSSTGTALLIRAAGDGAERTLVPVGPFRDLASPRFAPQADRLAFMAPARVIGGAPPALAGLALFSTRLARAHGVPWDVWLVGTDGAGLHRLAETGADDGTLSWSPDGQVLFVYGGSGSFLVDVASGNLTPLPYLTGYGTTAWLPG